MGGGHANGGLLGEENTEGRNTSHLKQRAWEFGEADKGFSINVFTTFVEIKY